ncbi:MAG: hypothetical protein HQ509_09495 [Candidatus Marinimicrobia bacterium]|nr:hypothetical protein [Candidatus Neomarinimicrobiota bacterium]
MLKSNGYLHLLVLIWVGISNPIFSQIETDIIEAAGLNPESEISDDDLEILTQIFYLHVDDIDDFRTLINNLSFSSVEDHEYLIHTSSFNSISQYTNTSVPTLIRTIATQIDQLSSQPQKEHFTYHVTQSRSIKYVGKIRVNGDLTQTGITFLSEPNPSLTYQVSSFYFMKKWTNRVLFVGDYQVLSGYGLLFWRSTSPYKGFDTINSAARLQTRIAPFRSSTNSWSMRGFALENTYNFGSLSFGYSQRRINGEIVDGYVALHSSNWAQAQLIERLTFIQSTYLFNRGKLGGTLAFSEYENSHSIQSYFRTTFFGNVTIRNSTVFGEISPTQNNSRIAGIVFKKQSFKYLGLYRSLSGHLAGGRQNPFSEWKSIERNESGMFQGLLYNHTPHYFSAYYDIFSQNKIPTDDYFIKSGVESGFRWEYRKNKLKLRVQLKTDLKSEDQNLYYFNQDILDNRRNTRSFTSYYTLNRGIKIKFQLVRVTASVNNKTNLGNGGCFNWHIKQKLHLWDISLIRANVKEFSSRLYFWDLNLPGEMRSVMISEPCISIAILYRLRFPLGGELGIRFRQTWNPALSNKLHNQFGLVLSTA